MDVPSADELLRRVQALPAAGPLLERLPPAPTVALVGGAVRDLLLDDSPGLDLDLVVDGDPAALTASLPGPARVHDRFGTATVELGGFRYDIARARRETYAHPGALPDVEPAPLAEDLRRRDFTVNTFAIALNGRDPGRLEHVLCAIEDLDGRRLRVLHDSSFVDDPTRLLRLCRYASRLHFAIEPHTEALARRAIETSVLTTVSGSRLGAELRLLAGEPDPVAALNAFRELGLDRAIDPDFGLEDRAIARRALELLGPGGRRDRLALALAAIHLPKPRLTRLLDTLAFDGGDRAAIVAAVANADRVKTALERAHRPSEIARAAAGASPELIAIAGALGPAEQAAAWLEQTRHVALEIDGGDLLAAGVPEGPAIGAGLRTALHAKQDGRTAGPEQELAEALRAARALLTRPVPDGG